MEFLHMSKELNGLNESWAFQWHQNYGLIFNVLYLTILYVLYYTFLEENEISLLQNV